MRLAEFEREALKRAAIDRFGAGTCVRLFGSRVDDQRRGGDTDLLLEVPLSDPAEIARAHTHFLCGVCAQMGEQKLDVLIDVPGRPMHPPIF